MVYHYFHIRFFETKNGKNEKAYSAFHHTPYPSTVDTLKLFLTNNVLKDPTALVTIFSLQPLNRDTYLSLGGMAPAE